MPRRPIWAEETSERRFQRLKVTAHPLAAAIVTQKVAISVEGIGVGDDDRRFELEVFGFFL